MQSSLGANFSINIKTDQATESSNTMMPSLTEKASELNMRDLDSSDDDLSAGAPNGGCTGEPQ